MRFRKWKNSFFCFCFVFSPSHYQGTTSKVIDNSHACDTHLSWLMNFSLGMINLFFVVVVFTKWIVAESIKSKQVTSLIWVYMSRNPAAFCLVECNCCLVLWEWEVEIKQFSFSSLESPDFSSYIVLCSIRNYLKYVLQLISFLFSFGSCLKFLKGLYTYLVFGNVWERLCKMII